MENGEQFCEEMEFEKNANGVYRERKCMAFSQERIIMKNS